ncbi:MAG: hypothetical protein JXA99_00585 [Candidatus Lokiarchaeota archaeon]|nr:hypothetical protein [Candidatus Lokiarchaeota archaeon]
MSKYHKKILFTQCYDTGSLKSDYLYRSPLKYRDHLLNKYPNISEWIKKEYFDLGDWPNNVSFMFMNKNINVPGHYLKDHIITPSKVIDEPINLDSLIKELEQDEYTHVGFSIISNDFSNFINYAKAVKDFDSSIETIAGGPGALEEDTNKYVDHVCIGNGVPFLRSLLGEDLNNPYKITIIPDKITYKFKDKEISSEQCKIITRIGCPFKCDFCVTNKLFEGYYSGDIFNPSEVHNALIKYRDKTSSKNLQVFWAEPTSVFHFKWWYELFDLFKNDDGDFSFFVASPSIILNKLDLDRISNSAARIGFVNVGIESFNKNYIKNRDINIKELIKRLFDHGISTYATYIIGFDFDKKDTIWTDINKLMDVDADLYSVLNLHPLPQTTTWNELKSKKRLLSLPPDFYHIHGFQSFLHPHFKPGFEDMLPLLYNIYRFIEQEKGSILINMARTYENLINYTNHPRIIRRDLKWYKNIGKILYPTWKEFFKPNYTQEKNYLNKIDT